MADVFGAGQGCYRNPMLQSPSRRSSMTRSPKGLRLELGPRDFAIFRLLQRYRYLPSNYIHAFVGGRSLARFKERLRDLYHEGLIDRPAEQWQFANARSQPAVYEAGTRMRRLLSDVGSPQDEVRTYLGAGAHRQFLHSLWICRALACFELGVLAEKGLGWIPWCEIRDRVPGGEAARSTAFRLPTRHGCVIPDGIFGLRYTGDGAPAYRFLALEIDRGTMPVRRSDPTQSSLLRKVQDYRQILAGETFKTSLGIPNLLVLTLTFAPSRHAEILKAVAALTGKSTGFLFQVLDEADLRVRPHQVATQLLRGPWDRAGCPPLGLGG